MGAATVVSPTTHNTLTNSQIGKWKYRSQMARCNLSAVQKTRSANEAMRAPGQLCAASAWYLYADIARKMCMVQSQRCQRAASLMT